MRSKPGCIRIINPPFGGSPYTSQKRANRFVRDGRAEVRAGMLWFLQDVPAPHKPPDSTDREAAKHRGGMFFWNGSVRDAGAMKRPGEVRS